MNEESQQTLSSPGTVSRWFWLFGKHSQDGSPAGRRCHFPLRQWKEAFGLLSRMSGAGRMDASPQPGSFPEAVCLLGRGLFPLEDRCSACRRHGCAWRPGSCASWAAWKLMAFLVFSGGNWEFPSKR